MVDQNQFFSSLLERCWVGRFRRLAIRAARFTCYLPTRFVLIAAAFHDVVGKFIVGEDSPWHNVRSHGKSSTIVHSSS
jgi:hypothetical protein